jgi:membrane protease YdiL (CAAX protease family)
MKESSSVGTSLSVPFPSANPAASRALSAFEFCVGAFIVIGHNVFHAPALANEVIGNIKIALVALLLVWTFAAFGEEIAYRGYLVTRAADIGRRLAAAYWIGGLCSYRSCLVTGIITKAHQV